MFVCTCPRGDGREGACARGAGRSQAARAAGTAASRSAAARPPTPSHRNRSGATARRHTGARPSVRSTGSRRWRGTPSAAPAPCGWPPTRRSETSFASSSRRSAKTGSRASGSTSCRRPPRRASRRRSSTRPTGRFSRRDSSGGSPCSPRRRGRRSAKASRVGSVADLDADQVVVATDGYPSGLLGPLEGLIVPTRGQMIATERIPERLFDRPHYSRHGFDYWQQLEDGRILAGGFRDAALDEEFTTVEETTPRSSRRSRPSSPTSSAGRCR